MGSRVSAMKLSTTIVSNNEKLLINEKIDAVNVGNRTVADVALKPQPHGLQPPSVRDAGSKDDSFFDTQHWFESDCEDDFHSVRGDFTPSLRNTPVHHKFSTEAPKANKSSFEEINISVSTPPSSNKKKKLIDLFKESIRDEQTETEVENETRSSNGTPYVSRASSMCSDFSYSSPNGSTRVGDERLKPTQCCLPRLLPRCIPKTRRKRTTPAHNRDIV